MAKRKQDFRAFFKEKNGVEYTDIFHMPVSIAFMEAMNTMADFMDELAACQEEQPTTRTQPRP